MKKKSLSVIICFYNSVKYLDRLLNSLLEQTFSDYELILVNDGSTDDSLLVCEKYRALFDDFTIITKENGGLVSARKVGVMAARGDYICCIDSDDWIERDYLKTLYDLQKKSDADIIVTGHYYDFDDFSKKVYGFIPEGEYNSEDIIDRMMYSGVFYVTGISQYFHGKLFKASILREIQLKVDDRIFVGEDVAVIYPAIIKSKRILVSSYCGYHYVNNLSSMVRTVGKDELFRLKLLTEYLKCYFTEVGMYNRMRYQLIQFEKCSMLTRCINCLDENDNSTVLAPFGGVNVNSKIVIYGAGILGQRIKSNYIDNGKLHLVKWVDQSFELYRKNEMDVNSPESLKNESNYDYIIIAITNSDVADKVRGYLMNTIGVSREKIRWLSEEFVKHE